ncbi:bifunctional helix-turn-helix transcriptional regulator/GNAT family N-acetyltransferase [Actibacterium pelagium]|uniref:PadR family transcriptional regulator n=1 Tax=Actibacterium pelagium TaxID=2029103 RepID=A0A917AGE1_9RHOB|nr:bifunctional helix-turn-helix transcriptional regulator/GNAT family N-acetyltransferase [Actibacterium pelagium]GGE50014.1 PadR family transcriptional regulator [Actibacterium pelagium]
MSLDPIARIRRFNRAVTSEAGALDLSFLGRGRPLGVARVLHGVGHFGQDVSTIREALNLDKAVMSRILKQLEEEGLLTLAPDPNDGRKRLVHLTEAGEAERAAYDSLSNDHAAKTLSRHANPTALLDAMDLVACALGRDRIEIAPGDPLSDTAAYCHDQYFAELKSRFTKAFEIGAGPAADADRVSPPHGAFLVASFDGLPIGCVSVRSNDGFGEIKRLWVSPSARGLGLARRLMDAAEDEARALGYTLLRLDTNSVLPEAIALYRKTGWTEIDRYNDDPNPDHFFEKQLN